MDPKGVFAKRRKEDALVALAGRHVKWTSLAVQQQRFETDSNADLSENQVLRHLKSGCFGIAASICASSTPIDKEYFDYRNS
jgi:hypothetical protein